MHTDRDIIDYQLVLNDSPPELIFKSEDSNFRMRETIVIHRFRDTHFFDEFRELFETGRYYRKTKTKNLNTIFKHLKNNPLLDRFLEVNKDMAILKSSGSIHIDIFHELIENKHLQ